MARQLHTPVKQVTDKPGATLQFVDNDDHSIKSFTETTVKGKKAEKSVHFASDTEPISSSQLSEVTSLDNSNSQDLISWMPSEHLYSDTFITETHAGTSSDEVNSDPAAFTYGSNTFIDESETNTESEYSSTKSLSSSEVFSSHTASETYREWRDVTEIIKDIEDLEESEFVRHRLDEDEDTDEFSDSLDHEIAEEARQDFLVSAIRRLTLASQLSPRSESSVEEPRRPYREQNVGPMKQKSKEQMSFCQKMIQRCRDNTGPSPPAAPLLTSELHTKAEIARQPMQPKVLEHYGLNSALVNRLKMDNLILRMDKKSRDLDKETEKSLNFVHGHQHIEEDEARKKFISQATWQVSSLSTEDRIQDHLIRMHPVKWFADFVNDLPNINEDSREILYKYKKQIEKRMEESGS